MSDNPYLSQVDYRDGIMPPWENQHLLGHDPVFASLKQRFDQGKNHHAILLKGSQGIGKATLAYHFARFIFQTTATAPNIPLFSHPNLYVLKRQLNDDRKKFRTTIAIKQIQDITEKLHQSPSVAGWRVVIVDPMDELRHEAANAFLKTLEEPPEKVQFLLICNRSAKILPTIKSRCMGVSLHDLDPDITHNVISHVSDFNISDEAIQNALGFFPKQPGQALEVYTSDLATLHSRVEALIMQALQGQNIDLSQAQALASEMQKKGREITLPIVMNFIWGSIAQAARSSAIAGEGGMADKLSQICEAITKTHAETETFNLDLLGALIKTLSAIQSVRMA